MNFYDIKKKNLIILLQDLRNWIYTKACDAECQRDCKRICVLHTFCGYFFQYREWIASHGRMTDLEESGRGEAEVFSQHSSGGTEENHEESSVRTVGVPAEIRTEHLPNTSRELCLLTNLLERTPYWSTLF
jgi:hypothetical protein